MQDSGTKKICISLVGLPTMKHRGSTFPPLTLIHLATVLGCYRPVYGLDMQVIDLQQYFTAGRLAIQAHDLHQRICDIIDPQNIDLVLLATMCNNLPLAVSLAQACKKINPDLVVGLGGLHATLVADRIVESFEAVDFVVRGEGEATLLEVVDAVALQRSLDTIDGLTFRNGTKTVSTKDRGLIDDLDELPMPDFSLVAPLDRYQPERTPADYATFIDVGRGCPFQCTFCAASRIWKKKVRQKSNRRIMAEMEHLARNYGIMDFFFNQDEFTLDVPKVTRLCNALIKAGAPFNWNIFARLDDFDPPLAKKLNQAGCRGIFMGIESGLPARLDKIGKKVPLEKARSQIHYFVDSGMECIASFILGFPDETRHEVDMTLKLAFELAGAGARVNLQLLAPVPGTRLWQEHGGHIELHPAFYPFYDNSEFLGSREHLLIEKHPDIFTVFYNYPTPGRPFAETFNIYYDFKRIFEAMAEEIDTAPGNTRISRTGSPLDWHTRLRRGIQKKHGYRGTEILQTDLLLKAWDEISGGSA